MFVAKQKFFFWREKEALYIFYTNNIWDLGNFVKDIAVDTYNMYSRHFPVIEGERFHSACSLNVGGVAQYKNPFTSCTGTVSRRYVSKKIYLEMKRIDTIR